MAAKLTDKQKVFCEEYLKDMNATKAAIRAGYSERNASNIAADLLQKSQVAEYLSKRMKEREIRTEITQDKVLKELAKVAFSEAGDTSKSNLKYANKVKALELVGKHLGMFIDRLMVAEVDPDVIRQVEKMVIGNDAE